MLGLNNLHPAVFQFGMYYAEQNRFYAVYRTDEKENLK